MSRKTRKDEAVQIETEGLPWWRRPGRSAVLSLLALTGLLIFAFSVLENLKSRVSSLPAYNPEPKLTLELTEAQKWVETERWQKQILASIHLPENPDWLDGDLTRRIGEQLQASGWVSEVKRVAQDVDGTIRVSAEFRRPIAMVRIKREEDDDYVYVAIDKEGVRLPQIYEHVEEAGWMEIVGIEGPPPPPGRPFEGEDATAAVRLAELIFRQEFAYKISRIDISNFRGRLNRRQDHIFLVTRGGNPSRIAWGSAIGEEFEEPSWQDKIRLISKTLEGGPPHVQADISFFPDRTIYQIDPPMQTADGSQTRDR